MNLNEGVMAEIDMFVDECLEQNPKATIEDCMDYIQGQIGGFENAEHEQAVYMAVKKSLRDMKNTGIEEAMELVKAFGYRVLKEDQADSQEDETDTDGDSDTSDETDPLEDEADEIKLMVHELADETGNDYADATVNTGRGPDGYGVEVTFGNEEYLCYEDYDSAVSAAEEDCKQIFDDTGIEGIRFDYIGGIENFVDEDWFEDARKESAESYVSDIHESEPDRYEEEFGDLDEDEAVEKYLEEDGYENDPIQWYIDNYGKNQFNQIVKENNLIDENKLAEEIVSNDGPANSLARYDGKEIELPCGYYCYRTN